MSIGFGCMAAIFFVIAINNLDNQIGYTSAIISTVLMCATVLIIKLDDINNKLK
jgi:hypothetical protein